jgi:group I intron endonuclease
MFYIYIIQNQLNNKLYVGKTKDLHVRWRDHKKIVKGGKEKYPKDFYTIHSAMKKYGVNNFDFFDVEWWENEDEAYEAEQFWIHFFRSNISNIGYNETPGGRGALSGEDHPMYGKHHSEETKKKMSASKLGKPSGALGRKHSDENKAIWSLQRTGPGHPMYGKHQSKEARQKISQVKLQNGKTKGEKHWKATLTNDQAIKISSLFQNDKMKISEIAKLYNTNYQIIYRIVKGLTFKN